MVIGQQHADHVLSRWAGACAKVGLDQRPAKVALFMLLYGRPGRLQVSPSGSIFMLARVQQALSAAEGEPPLQRLAAMGHAYLDWASAYPTHFRVISDRAQLDGGGSPAMTQANEGLRRQMRDLIAQALTPAASAKEQAQALVAARALVYGLARMAADGHLPEWQLPHTDAPGTLHGVLDFFIASLERRQPG